MSFHNSPVAIEMVSYKKRKPFEDRKTEVKNIKQKYPTKVPVVIERCSNEKYLPALDRTKFIFRGHETLADMYIILRRRMYLRDSEAIFLLINNKSMTNMTKTLSDIHRDDKDEDGFLYVTYASEKFYGN